MEAGEIVGGGVCDSMRSLDLFLLITTMSVHLPEMRL
jgi:hypothetical protein